MTAHVGGRWEWDAIIEVLCKMLFICLPLPSLSRYRLKFSADKVDTMIVQAICKYMAKSDLFNSGFFSAVVTNFVC